MPLMFLAKILVKLCTDYDYVQITYHIIKYNVN